MQGKGLYKRIGLLVYCAAKRSPVGMPMSIQQITAEQAPTHLPQLVELLQDAVAHGASVGYVAVPTVEEATAYWQGVITAVAAGHTLLFVAYDEAAVVGTAQLKLETRPNGSHRGEVARVLVHSTARRRGWGRALMEAVREAAVGRGLLLLVLDTRAGDPSQQLYTSLGYQLTGIVPRYARSTTGVLDACAFMHLDL